MNPNEEKMDETNQSLNEKQQSATSQDDMVKDTENTQEASAANDSPADATKSNEESTDNNSDKEQDKKNKKGKANSKQMEAEEKVQEMGEKLAEMNDRYVRMVADFDNYRKRTQQQMADLVLNGGKEVIKDILPILDDMERALSTIPDDNTAKEGQQLIFNKLITTLQQKGLKVMEAQGQKFDEELHNAVAQIPATDESQKGMVIDVVQTGYYLRDKVLRHAKVVVAI